MAPSKSSIDDGMNESGAALAAVDDAGLVQAILAGDPRAKRATWQRFVPLVRRIIRRSLGPEDDIEDAVQEVFLRLFTRIHTLRDHGALRAFVVSITMFGVRYEIRRRRLRRLVGLAPAAGLAELRVVHADHGSRMALSRFCKILERIGARERSAFVLRHIEELSDAGVAAALGVSLPTARRLSARAYERVTYLASRDAFLAGLVPSSGGQP